MEFIVVIVGLFILHRAGSLPALQRDTWYRGWTTRLGAQHWLKVVPHGRLIFSLLLPVLLVALLLVVVDDHWFGLPQFFLSLCIFLYSLGRGDLEEQVEGYQNDLKRDDLQAAYHDAADFNPAHQEGDAENWSQLHNEALGAISYRYFERYFAVMFWFMLAGAPGAILYRLSVLHSDMSLDNAADKSTAERWLQLMEWLPARLIGISFAFVGNFTACLERLRSTFFSMSGSTVEVVTNYVSAALQSGSVEADSPLVRETEVSGVRALFSRTLVFSLCMIALSVILL
ncbi:MAG: regulatory signaling modulator protein AmpE [Porticoccus sp.]|nr:regulatory signaling modulator protein AmpE [Porticoccus sp.]MBQ0807638.1 regulatory signaling modulator protein AmpE [Porticoccus sp.]